LMFDAESKNNGSQSYDFWIYNCNASAVVV
jgi:hypothetical protein